MHQAGGTIEQILKDIAANHYVLPAIQREFVWGPGQICALFDSVMQGYPFGEFLFWRIEPENSAKYRCYGFVREYHERDNPHCPDLGILADKPLTAVLDGQQRLTAFNIGLRGSLSIKQPRKWRSSPDAFPRRVLALDLLDSAERDEDGNCYQFKFIESHETGCQGDHLWFIVPEILNMEDGPAMHEWLVERDLSREQQKVAYRRLHRLYQVIRENATVAYYEERNQNIEHVLNIFTRCNSGGTPLAYSDLLLSIAVSQWDERDARQEVHTLVDELNAIGDGIGLSKDFVLKAGLMLTDIASVGFQVRNFTHENMAKLEENWPRIRAALMATVKLITGLGFNSHSVRSVSALLPIAYYLYKLNVPLDFDSHPCHENDRKAIKGWLVRSILKASGIWGSGLDTLLTALREVLREAGDSFPIAELHTVMAHRGKSLDFTPEEIEDLADMGIGDRRCFALLTLVFPFIDVHTHRFHIDHVFPKSLLTPSRLAAAGVAEEEQQEIVNCANRIANLQLLEGIINNDKRAKLPKAWMEERYPDLQERNDYCNNYLLGTVPTEIGEFMSFYKTRRQRLQKHIAELVRLV